MLENINNEFNTDIAVLCASNQCDREIKEVNYEELIESDEYILITDPIKRIADMNY